MKRFLLTLCLLLVAAPAWSTVLFSRIADDTGTVNTAVATTVWDHTGSGETPDNRFFYRNSTPVPGHTLYFQNDFLLGMLDAYNITENFTQIDLTVGQTYYFGAFFRFDRINDNDIWHDTSAPDSYDKLLEFDGTIRWMFIAGFANGSYFGSYDHHFTFDLYSSPVFCTNCGINDGEQKANVSPYDANNPYLCDYGRWYAVVMAYTPSSGGAATNGLVELWINGTKTTSLAQKTQDSTTPNIFRFAYSGTVAQPSYDAPAHTRKLDHVIFATSLTDMQNAGLMSDPEAGGGGGSSTGGSMDVKRSHELLLLTSH